ncbi:MAG: GNAT family N-acetyltransferase [Spirochaeta sp.]
MPYYPKIRGSRVYLSPIDVADAPQYVEWLNDMEVAENLMVSGMMISMSNEPEFLAGLAKKHTYGIVDAATDSLIGNCGLDSIDQLNGTAEAGIFIGSKAHWGRGYGSEALTALVGYGFDFLNLHAIYLRVYGCNQRAIRSYERAGFKHAGRLRKAICLKGSRHDLLYMDITREDAAPAQAFEPSP